jgi:predicted N-acetyltransferase YhbS
MPDMLVKLYALPELSPYLERMRPERVVIRVAMPYERTKLTAWIRERFGESWAVESEMAFANRPISCFIATRDGHLLGFGCYDCTCRDYFGPVGVDEHVRSGGIGRALLLSCLHAMASLGYGYAIIGAVHDVDFYRRAVGAIEIEGSSPGIYRDRLK